MFKKKIKFLFLSLLMAIAILSGTINLSTRNMAAVQACSPLYTVNTNNVNLRSGAGTNHASHGQVHQGTNFRTSATVGAWRRGTVLGAGVHSGTVGYIHSNYLRFVACI
ncbi:MAG: SH3 domain-containing protein [Defluviitaleaceae bacterium]|nr:SH3 domain-containing protein [Defluviitaleaceae bacterium]